MMTSSLAGGHRIAIVVQKTEVKHQIAGCHCPLWSPFSLFQTCTLFGNSKEHLCKLGKNFGNSNFQARELHGNFDG
jgi:hypothetical protein